MGTNKSTTEDEKDTQDRQKCLNPEMGFARLGLKLKVEQEEEEGEGKVCTACGLSVCGATGTEPGLQDDSCCSSPLNFSFVLKLSRL